MYLGKERKMNKYLNLKLAIDSESVNVYVETGGEPVHVVYWHMDEWLEDAESSVPATINAVHLFYTNPDELIEKVSGVGVPDIRASLITPEELKQFKKDWGQSHSRICSELGYSRAGSDELLMDDYFWIDDDKKWYNKCSSLFTEKEELIANFLRYSE
jgi:hypothetical protein